MWPRREGRDADAGRAAVDDRADRRAVAFPPGGQAEQVAEAVMGHGVVPSDKGGCGGCGSGERRCVFVQRDLAEGQRVVRLGAWWCVSALVQVPDGTPAQGRCRVRPGNLTRRSKGEEGRDHGEDVACSGRAGSHEMWWPSNLLRVLGLPRLCFSVLNAIASTRRGPPGSRAGHRRGLRCLSPRQSRYPVPPGASSRRYDSRYPHDAPPQSRRKTGPTGNTPPRRRHLPWWCCGASAN